MQYSSTVHIVSTVHCPLSIVQYSTLYSGCSAVDAVDAVDGGTGVVRGIMNGWMVGLLGCQAGALVLYCTPGLGSPCSCDAINDKECTIRTYSYSYSYSYSTVICAGTATGTGNFRSAGSGGRSSNSSSNSSSIVVVAAASLFACLGLGSSACKLGCFVWWYGMVCM